MELNLVVISHSLVKESNRHRWRILADEYPVDVTLIVPEYWRSDRMNERIEYEPERIDEGSFHVFPLPTTNNERWWRYFYRSADLGFRELDPDVIYVLHSELNTLHHQVALYRNLWARDAELLFFTMNALGIPQEKLHQRLRWWHHRRNADVALCHYEGCKESLRGAGFDKPIYLQTQHGVDERLFYPDADRREEMRRQLGVENTFVIGFVGRLTTDKGVDTILDAVPLDGVDCSLLIVGAGELEDELRQTAQRRGLADQLHMPGFVPQEEVPDYMRAMDTFVIGSRTTENWIDTFPLAPVQAMACERPTVVSDSGALPFQVGDAGLVFPEGDSTALHEHLQRLADDEQFAEDVARQCRTRCVNNFTTTALAENFYDILAQITNDDITFADPGEEYDQTRAR